MYTNRCSNPALTPNLTILATCPKYKLSCHQMHKDPRYIDIEKLLQGLQQLFQQPNHHAIHMHPINAASTPQISCNLNCGNTICRNPQNVKKQAQITSCKAKMNSMCSIVQYSTRNYTIKRSGCSLGGSKCFAYSIVVAQEIATHYPKCKETSSNHQL